ncbi:MAG: AMP-binding protein, partial [Acidobacteria bacterium]|nr:AMP-binding protein [Acidobacteriota bacterium]
MDDFNNTGALYPKNKTIHQLFEEQAERTPANIAAAAPANGENYEYLQQVTYRKLNEISDHLSYYLREKGVYPENIIGMTAKRSILMIVEILSILKSGCAYMPIDQEFPQERIDFMIKDSGAKLMAVANELEGEQVLLESIIYDLNHLKRHPRHGLHHSNLAYVIYTSGSTGRPKGVMVEHQNVIRLIKNTNYIKFNNGDKILQTGALSFDASTFEIWGSLLNGLQLLLVPKDLLLNPDMLKKSLRKFDISTIWMTSPLFNQMVEADLDIFTGLKNLIVGGDVLSTFHINQVRKKNTVLNIINGYGPTENTTFSTTYPIENLFNEKIPIGKPITNSTAYIVDKFGNLQPTAIAGEIWVGGCGVARGYLNNPELTWKKFRPLITLMPQMTQIKNKKDALRADINAFGDE